ncbi:hypothetical protein [Halorubellus sp. PRR65]|uniref:hypothetical protein n=1 Tax=Halorubellus sp. PRR65 TaxID=3098148 RepID=UPI002B259C04|nr:hypothetical protein [Halorubellus sp. PRR65]
MDAVEKAKFVAAAITTLLVGVPLLACFPHIGKSGSDMYACVFPTILQTTTPNSRLVFAVGLVFLGGIAWRWRDSGGF